jgi:DNA-binding NarL/FixJ family response regulator
MKERIRVVLADDTLIAREGWRKILETEDDIEIVGEVTVPQETLQKVRTLRPDVLLMDLRWWEDDSAGISAIAHVKHDIPGTKIVAITNYNHLVAGARRAGAEAVLPKGFSRSELLDTIRALRHVSSFPVPVESGVADEQLSEREYQVLALMAKGLIDKEIAVQLNVAPGTVKGHIRNIFSTLGASNRAQAVAIGFERGIIRKGDL